MKILISGYTGLGNFILKTPMIKKIKELYPNSTVDLITGNSFGVESVLKKENGLIDDILILKQDETLVKKVKFIKDLKKYDAVFLPFDAIPKFLLFGLLFSNVKKIYMHFIIHKKLQTFLSFLLPKTKLIQALPGRHEIDLNYDLLELFHNMTFDREYDTLIDFDNDDKVLSKFDILGDYIVLQVGAANGQKSAKKWPIKSFHNLIEKVNNELNVKVVLVGDKGDYENDIKQLENSNLDFINTAGKTSLNEVLTILRFSKCVIANDSGVMHMANALTVNLIALYGPTDYSRTKPLSKKAKILYSKTDLFMKMYNFKSNELDLYDKYPEGMDGIKVENVFDKLREVIYDK